MESEYFADDVRGYQGGELINEVHLAALFDSVQQLVGSCTDRGAQFGDEAEGKGARQGCASLPVSGAVGVQHRVTEDVEQITLMDALGAQSLRLHLARAGIAVETFDIAGSNRNVTPIIAP